MGAFTALILFLMASSSSFGQNVKSRQEVNGVSDASVTKYSTKTVADTLGATVDTIDIRPNAQYQRYHVNVKDSSAIRLKSLAGCYFGDVIDLDIVNPTITGNFIYLSGVWVVSTGTAKISLTSAKSSYLRFWFNGSDFVETSRNLNYTR